MLHSSGRSSVCAPLPESMARYIEIYSKDVNKRSTGGGTKNKRQELVS